MSKKRGLGRGLDALIPSGGKEKTDLVELPLAEIQPNPRQARKNFDEEAISELAASIEQHGLIQPVIVRRSASGSGYELVAGERRYRAYRRLGRTMIPAIIRDLGDFESTAALLIENVQRQDLSSLEEAQAYRRLIEEFGLTQEEVARQVGKSRTAITNSLRLLSLPED
ncbi:ParB/RepB/Spo0J family partition protein, partial [Desulforudis sp. 1190]|uniref:ParB/RepB/Spo0J family partition protein n=1 Tax=Desulforudis sp. 1190 TaxID=3416136 RepID=UPI003CEFED53